MLAAAGAGSLLIARKEWIQKKPQALAAFSAAKVSLQVAAGEFVALVGPSGCGKTTLLNLCAGLIPAPPQGRLAVCGEPVRLGGRRSAYMLARDSLLPRATALDNAAFGLKMHGTPAEQRRGAARKMLARVGLGGFENAYPKALSQGMRQRVALARLRSRPNCC